MARKKSPSPSPIQIGNCEVVLEAGNFTCASDPKSLRISVTKNAKVKIYVKEELDGRNDGDAGQPKRKEREGRLSSLTDDYMFVLVNPKDGDSHCTSYLQEVLKIYTKELPAMNYAANTGKQSMFLKRCVSSGKYSTLLLESKPMGGSVEVIAAITFQIVPFDTQYAEVPLTAVSSPYQHKGLGHYIFMELRQRLQSVGIRTIYCWGDEESKGFWLKQGFSTIAEIDHKGRAHRLPIRADIRKALCFPGGSILMVSHVKGDILAKSLDSLKFGSQERLREKLTSATDLFIMPASTAVHASALKSHSSHTKVSVQEETNLGGLPQIQCSVEPVHFEQGNCSKKTANGAEGEVKNCSCNPQVKKKRVWETSLSSLKLKKVKGTLENCCESHSSWGLDSENDRFFSCLRGSLGNLEYNGSFVDIAPSDPSNGFHVCSDSKDGPVNMVYEVKVSKELQSRSEHFRIMLMNIADDAKKMHLSKVTVLLGGAVTPDGSVSTHVVTGKVRTTLNFCSALSSGAWIVSSSWLKESFCQGRFVDETPHLLADEDYAVKYGIELKVAIFRAKANPGALFKEYNICIATHVHPPIRNLSAIVRCAGGNVIRRLANVKQAPKTIYIACEEDMEEALSAAKKGILTFSSEWLINCIMRQELDMGAQQFAESLS